MPTSARAVNAKIISARTGQHKRRARRGWRRRDDAKARHKFCTSRFAWPEGTDAGSTSAAEGLQNLGFDGVLSSLSFAVERKGAARGTAQGITDRHTSDIGHWFAMTGFAWSAMGGGTHGSRPTKRSPHRHVYRRGDLRFYSCVAQILHGRIPGTGGRAVLGQLGDKGAVQPAEAQQRNEQREYL